MYQVLTFPSYLGSPVKFKWLWSATLHAWLKSCVTLGEVRVVDSAGNTLKSY
jgi:hypothetical protein